MKSKIVLIIYLMLIISFASSADAQMITAGEDSTSYLTFHNIKEAWKLSDGTGVKVAVLDWMFDLSSEAAQKYIEPVSMVQGQDIGEYKPWHGEWMAEIIHRIAPGTKIMPIRTRPASKKDDNKAAEPNYQKYLIAGIKYAANHGAAIITNSMGPVKNTNEFNDAVNYAAKRGAVFIDVHPEFTRKDKSKFIFCTPAELNKLIIHPGIVSVPNHPARPDEKRDIYTWPYDIKPVYKDGWGYSNGPAITAGITALMKSVNPELSVAGLKQILIKTAKTKNDFKIIDALAAVKESEIIKKPKNLK